MKRFLAVAFALTMFFGVPAHSSAFADETYDDMYQLEKNCGLKFGGDYDYNVKLLQENYESIGIRFRAYDEKANEYYDKREGKFISRFTALEMLIEFGHRNGRYGRE